jgi:hypothetical protein
VIRIYELLKAAALQTNQVFRKEGTVFSFCSRGQVLEFYTEAWAKLEVTSTHYFSLKKFSKVKFLATITMARLYQCQYELGAPNSHCFYAINKETRLGRTLNNSKLRVVPCQKTRFQVENTPRKSASHA